MGKLVSDEDTARAWFDALDLHGIDEETIKSWPHQERTLFERLFALRIETLIRKRLAERLRAKHQEEWKKWGETKYDNAFAKGFDQGHYSGLDLAAFLIEDD